MKKTTTLLASLLVSIILLSQTPGIKWQRTIGGNDIEGIKFTVKTIDNAILLVGATSSADGAFAANHGASDIWVEKLSIEGVTIWRKMLGGSGEEGLNAYYYNTDGSVVLMGYTESVDGDITGNHGGLTGFFKYCCN